MFTLNKTINMKWILVIFAASFLAQCSGTEFSGSSRSEVVNTEEKSTETEDIKLDAPLRLIENHQVFTIESLTKTNTESIIQPKAVLDILVVMDDSGSMRRVQDDIQARLPALLAGNNGRTLNNADWKMTVITTSAKVVREDYPRTFSANDSDFEDQYADAIAAGLKGSGEEEGLKQAIAGLRHVDKNGNSWMRPNSKVAVLIVSDEPNCGEDHIGLGNFSECDTGIEEVQDVIQNELTLNLGSDIRFYGIIDEAVGNATNSCTNNLSSIVSEWTENPLAINRDGYFEIIKASGGTVCNISGDQYEDALNDISKDLVNLVSQYDLAFNPNSDSVSVQVEGQPRETATFAINDKTITFQNEFDSFEGSEISISYSYLEKIIPKAFKFEKVPASLSSVEVNLNGNIISSEAYTIDNNELVLKSELDGGPSLLIDDEISLIYEYVQ